MSVTVSSSSLSRTMITIMKVPATTALYTGPTVPMATPRKSAAGNARIEKIDGKENQGDRKVPGRPQGSPLPGKRSMFVTFFMMFEFLFLCSYSQPQHSCLHLKIG